MSSIQTTERKQQIAFIEFVHSVLDENPNEINRVEELFLDQPLYLAALCLILVNNGKAMVAKGIFIRNKLKIRDFHQEHLGLQIQNMKYDKDQDVQPLKDYFDPVTPPFSKYLRLPSHIEVRIIDIDSDEQIGALKEFHQNKYKVIGVSGQRKPNIFGKSKNPMSLVVFSTKNLIYVVKM